MSTYDTIVIGGGHNGLVTAAYLAKAGQSVLVLEAREVLAAAERDAGGHQVHEQSLWVTGERAALGLAGTTEVAEAELARREVCVGVPDRMRVRYLLWLGTRAPAHLTEARRLLDIVLERLPPARRDAVIEGVALHRAIAAAAAEVPE